MLWLFGSERDEAVEIGQRSSCSSVTSLMEIKNPILLLISAFMSLLTGIIIFFAGAYSIYKKKYLIIEYEINPDEEMVMIPIVFFNILNFLIALSQMYFFISIKNQSDQNLIKFVFSFLNWQYPIIQSMVSSLYIIGAFSPSTLLVTLLKVANSILLIVLVTPFYKTIKSKRGLDVISLITLFIYMSVLLSIATFSFWQNSIDLLADYCKPARKELLTYLKPVLSNIAQLLIGICLLAYFKDVLFLTSSSIFFFFTNFLISLEFKDRRRYGLGINFCVSFLIILWFTYHKKKQKEQRSSIINSSIDYSHLKTDLSQTDND